MHVLHNYRPLRWLCVLEEHLATTKLLADGELEMLVATRTHMEEEIDTLQPYISTPYRPLHTMAPPPSYFIFFRH